jgi:hypothetical protein
MAVIFGHSILAAIAFLIVLNGHLNGRKKAQIDAALGLALLVVLLLFAFCFGVSSAVWAGIASAFYGAVLKPISARVAKRLLDWRPAPPPSLIIDRLAKDLEELQRKRMEGQ